MIFQNEVACVVFLSLQLKLISGSMAQHATKVKVNTLMIFVINEDDGNQIDQKESCVKMVESLPLYMITSIYQPVYNDQLFEHSSILIMNFLGSYIF